MLGLGNSLQNATTSYSAITSAWVDHYSIAFDGTGDYFDLGKTFQSIFRNSFSISFWCKVTDGQGTGNKAFFGSRNSGGADEINLVMKNDGLLNLYYRSDSYPALQYESDAAVFANGANDWKHIVVTLTEDANGLVAVAPLFYVDGSAIAATLDASTIGNVISLFATTDNLYIGGRNNNGSLDLTLNGSMNDFAIWNVALDADAVTAIYNSGSATDLRVNAGNYDNSSNLVAYWDFESQAGPGQDLISGDTGSFGGDPLRVNDAP